MESESLKHLKNVLLHEIDNGHAPMYFAVLQRLDSFSIVFSLDGSLCFSDDRSQLEKLSHCVIQLHSTEGQEFIKFARASVDVAML